MSTFDELEFVVPGSPVPKGRPRVLRNGSCYTPRRTKEYEGRVKECALIAHETGYCVMRGAVGMNLEFYLSRRATARPDLDNLVKSVKDALNGIAYEDDCQVVFIQAQKITVEKGTERAWVRVYKIQGTSK